MRELVSRQVVLAEVREWFDQRGIDGEHLLAVLEQIPSESMKFHFKPTRWMPLPEPTKEDAE